MFDDEDSLPDLDFHAEGLGAPLRLHRAILAAASSLVQGVMRSKTAARSGDADSFVWDFDTAAPADARALVAALRFCYGAALRVGTAVPAACSAAVAALVRLQVRCARAVAALVVRYAAATAARDVARGAEMLCACRAYPECCDAGAGCALDRALARAVLTRANLCAHYATVVDRCLMRLPPAYLALAQYGPAHTEQSEFSVRLRYLRYHRLAPDSPTARAIVAPLTANSVKSRSGGDGHGGGGDDKSGGDDRASAAAASSSQLSADELAHLRTAGFLTTAELADRALCALAACEERERAQRRCAGAGAEARAVAAEARAGAAEARAQALRRALLFAPLAYTRSVRTAVSTGCREACHCGAAFDGARRAILSTSSAAAHGRDLFVTRIVDSGYGTTVRHPALIPFRTQDRQPVYDGARYLYFAEHAFNGFAPSGGRRFGRVDVAALVWHELPPLPLPRFAPWFGGCFHRGTVYAVDADLALCAYDVASAKWSRCRPGPFPPPSADDDDDDDDADGNGAHHPLPPPIRVPSPNEFCGVRLLADPADPPGHLYAVARTTMSGLYRIDIPAGTVTLVSTPPLAYDLSREAALVRVDAAEIVVVLCLRDGVWCAYSSRWNTWARLAEWAPFPGKATSNSNHNYLVYAEPLHTFFYHVSGNDTWHAVYLSTALSSAFDSHVIK